jgi:hypothetical protein
MKWSNTAAQSDRVYDRYQPYDNPNCDPLLYAAILGFHELAVFALRVEAWRLAELTKLGPASCSLIIETICSALLPHLRYRSWSGDCAILSR